MANLTRLEITCNKVSTLTHGNGSVCVLLLFWQWRFSIRIYKLFYGNLDYISAFQVTEWVPLIGRRQDKRKMQRRTQKEVHK